MLLLLMALLTGPGCEDVESFVSYLIQLIHGCNLEHVALLLRYVDRSVSSLVALLSCRPLAICCTASHTDCYRVSRCHKLASQPL